MLFKLLISFQLKINCLSDYAEGLFVFFYMNYMYQSISFLRVYFSQYIIYLFYSVYCVIFFPSFGPLIFLQQAFFAEI